ncbi:MAG: hypothetical protein EOP43_05180, partial [Sphingobacteriaceae bacterium]
MIPSNILITDKICKATNISLSKVFDWNEFDSESNKLEPHQLNEVCWENPLVVPKVSFAVAYHPEILLIKFYVKENTHQAIYKFPNDPV